ncbi:MAG: TerC/Alx family metal homeostasis membrane protein [Alphaproteobacteria bacterium]|nr:TerC/Alx family metal homeostasis membrane protein [Alphaproteobacteria bacterium]
METSLLWIGLIVLILIFLIIDLGVFNRIPHVISAKEALKTSLCWVGLSLLFNLFVWYDKGPEPAVAFFTGYLLEKLLSLDNMFIFLVIFNTFGIAPRHHHRILFWGILGAIVFRLIFILLGLKLIETFSWIFYLFGAALIYSAYKIYQQKGKPIDIENNRIVQLVKKWFHFQENYKGRRFFLKIKGKWVATPGFLVLVIIEVCDIIFAIDSIPAIFAITLDPFIVFTSNIFAVLGLRALYFLLADIIPRFYYLQHAISIILGFIGIKLILANHFEIPLIFSLSFMGLTFFIAIVASYCKDKYISEDTH